LPAAPANEPWTVASGRWSVFPSKLRSLFGGIGKGAVKSYGQLPYPSKIKESEIFMKRDKRRLITLIALLTLFINSSVTLAQDNHPQAKKAPSPEIDFQYEMNSFSASTFKFFESKYFGKVVQGAPYSATAITEHVQKLSDGNQIIRKNEAKIYRDSEGRTRREQKLENIGKWTAAGDAPQMIYINDPVAGVTYNLDPRTRTGRKGNVAFKYQTEMDNEQRIKEKEARLKEIEKRSEERAKQHEEEMKKRETRLKEQALEHEEMQKQRSIEREKILKERTKEREAMQKQREKLYEERAKEKEKRYQEMSKERVKEYEERAAEREKRNKEQEIDRERQLKERKVQMKEREQQTKERKERLKLVEKQKKEIDQQSKSQEKALKKEIADANAKKKIEADAKKKIEALGKQTIEGVEAEGKRSTRTITAGEIGNTLPIEIIDESWYSAALQVQVMSKHSDPRSGVTTYRLTNISRSEPDRSLFEVPSDYTIVNDSTFKKRVTKPRAPEKTSAPGSPAEPAKKPAVDMKPAPPKKAEPAKMPEQY
jgi:hypothetical protein